MNKIEGGLGDVFFNFNVRCNKRKEKNVNMGEMERSKANLLAMEKEKWNKHLKRELRN